MVQCRLYEQQMLLHKTIGCVDLKMSYFIFAGPLINKHLILGKESLTVNVITLRSSLELCSRISSLHLIFRSQLHIHHLSEIPR